MCSNHRVVDNEIVKDLLHFTHLKLFDVFLNESIITISKPFSYFMESYVIRARQADYVIALRVIALRKSQWH